MKKTYRFAPDYELEYKERTLDLDFWIKLVKELKVKSVLELGVGTGRVFFPLVDKLYSQLEQAVGIDADSFILSQAKKKLSSEFSRLKDKVELKKKPICAILDLKRDLTSFLFPTTPFR